MASQESAKIRSLDCDATDGTVEQHIHDPPIVSLRVHHVGQSRWLAVQWHKMRFDDYVVPDGAWGRFNLKPLSGITVEAGDIGGDGEALKNLQQLSPLGRSQGAPTGAYTTAQDFRQVEGIFHDPRQGVVTFQNGTELPAFITARSPLFKATIGSSAVDCAPAARARYGTAKGAIRVICSKARRSGGSPHVRETG